MGGLALAFAACVGAPCVIFYLQLRHWLFVGLALWPPVAVVSVVILFGRGDFDQALVAALFGTVSALSLATGTVRRISAGLTPGTAFFGASRNVAFSMGFVFIAYLVSLCVDAAVLGDWRRCAATAMLFVAGFSAAFAGSSLCAYFPFSEHAIADANAAREWRERMLDRAFPEMQARWAFSVSGIGIVLGAVAVFGIRDAHVHWHSSVLLYVPVGLLCIIAGFVGIARDWRATAALALTAVFNASLLLWATARRDYYPDSFSMNAMLILSSAPLAVLAMRTRQHAQEGDGIGPALAAAIRDEGAIAVALGVFTGLPGLFSTITSTALSPALVFAVAATFAAVLLFPALTIAIYALIPRYRTADEVFGKR